MGGKNAYPVAPLWSAHLHDLHLLAGWSCGGKIKRKRRGATTLLKWGRLLAVCADSGVFVNELVTCINEGMIVFLSFVALFYSISSSRLILPPRWRLNMLTSCMRLGIASSETKGYNKTLHTSHVWQGTQQLEPWIRSCVPWYTSVYCLSRNIKRRRERFSAASSYNFYGV